MKTRFFPILLIISTCFLVLTSCGDKACKEVACVHGVCEDGTCFCESGWTGTNCEVQLCVPDCGPHGTCVSGVCDCDPGWTGPTCSVADCVPACVNGTCVSGTCDCDPGWDGPACDQVQTAKFVRNYNVSEVCTSGAYSYSCNITASTVNMEDIYFSNLYDLVGFYGISTPIRAIVSGSNFSIPSQMVTNGTTNLYFSGSGSRASSGVVTVTFVVTDGVGGTDSCTDTFNPI